MKNTLILMDQTLLQKLGATYAGHRLGQIPELPKGHFALIGHDASLWIWRIDPILMWEVLP